jgi:hypothetical protein
VPLGLGNVDASVKAIYHLSKFYNSTSEAPPKEALGLILDQTNFYAESGGQEHDTGRIVIDGKADFVVEEVQVFNGYVLHIGYMAEGELSIGDKVVSAYDEVSPVSIFVPIRLGAHVVSSLAAPSMAHPQQPHWYSYPQLCAPRGAR